MCQHLLPGLTKAPASIIVYQRTTTNSNLRRLARRGGVKRISAMIYDDTRDAMKAHLQLVSTTHSRDRKLLIILQILKDCVIFLDHANRKTVTVGDVQHPFCSYVSAQLTFRQVLFALKRIGRPIYGFGNGYLQSDAPNRKKRKD